MTSLGLVPKTETPHMKPSIILSLLLLPLTLANEALQEVIAGNNLFAASVYKELQRTETGNFLLSPFSAEAILALVQSGAREDTAEEFKKALHLPPQQDLEFAFRSLTPQLRKNGPYILQTANKIYLKNDFAVRDQFKRVANVFDAELQKIDFTSRGEAAAVINQWVEERTNNKIKNLIKASDLDGRTRAVLINALYFQGNWTKAFKKYQTFKQDFFRNGNEAIPVETMHMTDDKKYFESKELNARFLELPFRDGEVTLTIVLPNEKDGISTLENQLTKVLERPKYVDEYVKISLPKFRIESRLDLKAILQRLGVQKAFRDDEADLSGIAGEKGDLVIDKVLQKTFVDVSEKGVEAAAATYVAVAIPLAGIISTREPIEFKVDHPFIFYIKVKDLTIFAGRVMDPSA